MRVLWKLKYGVWRSKCGAGTVSLQRSQVCCPCCYSSQKGKRSANLLKASRQVYNLYFVLGSANIHTVRNYFVSRYHFSLLGIFRLTSTLLTTKKPHGCCATFFSYVSGTATFQGRDPARVKHEVLCTPYEILDKPHCGRPQDIDFSPQPPHLRRSGRLKAFQYSLHLLIPEALSCTSLLHPASRLAARISQKRSSQQQGTKYGVDKVLQGKVPALLCIRYQQHKVSRAGSLLFIVKTKQGPLCPPCFTSHLLRAFVPLFYFSAGSSNCAVAEILAVPLEKRRSATGTYWVVDTWHRFLESRNVSRLKQQELPSRSFITPMRLTLS